MTVNAVRNLEKVKEKIALAAKEAGTDPQDITLVAVSKYASLKAVKELIAAGHRDFGENRVKDGLGKLEAIAEADIRWHMIGRLQTNKLKYISPFYLIQSLDRWDLAVKMSEYARRHELTYQCLVQVNVANDPAKGGIRLEEVEDFLIRVAALEGLSIRGLMTITALDAEEAQTRAWFERMATKFRQLGKQSLPASVRMDWLSMGMSADYEMAVAAGANLVRVGSAIFAAKGDEDAT